MKRITRSNLALVAVLMLCVLVGTVLADTLAFSGFYTHVRPFDGTNALSTASNPFVDSQVNNSVTLAASQVFPSGRTNVSAVTSLGQYREGVVVFNTTVVTGGPTARVFLQISPDGGTTWTDYCAFTDVTTAVPQWTSFSGAIAGVVPGVTTDITLAQSTCKIAGGGSFGAQMRVVVNVTAGTSITASAIGHFKG